MGRVSSRAIGECPVSRFHGGGIDAGSRTSLIQVMETYIISEAKPKLGELVKRAAAGHPVYLLNGKDMVALVPARPTHDAPEAVDVDAVNARLAASEKTPVTAWKSGDALRIARRSIRRKTNP
jgi:prevent-host-death family protein